VIMQRRLDDALADDTTPHDFAPGAWNPAEAFARLVYGRWIPNTRHPAITAPRAAQSLREREAALIMAHQIDPFCVHHLADTECLTGRP
jgi:hypothetical protein